MTVGRYAFLTSAAPEQLKVPLAMLLVFGSAKLPDEVFERVRQPRIAFGVMSSRMPRQGYSEFPTRKFMLPETNACQLVNAETKAEEPAATGTFVS